ncbi:MAG TPA: NADH-quinone oxidoreductase subunit C [Nitrososphaera sp.]|nr:NADH-quinone oxidoreductase subunit C [Nitrososphaera sp.]
MSDKEEQKKPAPPAKTATPAAAADSDTTANQPTSKAAPPATAATKPAAASPPVPAAAAKPVAAKPAAPTAAKKEPEPPAFEKGIAQQLVTRFGDAVKILYIRPLRIKVYVEPENLVEIATYIRDNMGFDHAECASGTDYLKDGKIEIDYHLGSYMHEELLAQILILSTRTNRDDSHIPSLINVFKSVEYHERETFEMLGVYFDGHPRNERFLLPEDWADIPPLRKEFRIKGR